MIRAGGEARALYHAWKASGADPYRLYNGLEQDYRPIGQPDAQPRPPRFPERVRTFVYACALHAEEQVQQRHTAMMKMLAGKR